MIVALNCSIDDKPILSEEPSLGFYGILKPSDPDAMVKRIQEAVNHLPRLIHDTATHERNVASRGGDADERHSAGLDLGR